MTATFAIVIGDVVEEYVAEWHSEIFPPKKPEVTVKAEAGRFGGKSLELTFIIGITNPNPFALKVGEFDYTLWVKGVEISRDSLARGQRLVPSSELQFDVRRLVGKDDLANLAVELSKLDTIPYRLAGRLTVDGIAVEVSVPGEIHFAQ